jgi:hypothetical protein
VKPQVNPMINDLERPPALTATTPDLPLFSEKCGPDVAQ